MAELRARLRDQARSAGRRSRLRYRRRMGSTLPGLDAGARQRLTARFGNQVASWFDELPGVLSALAQRWRFELGPPIPRGSMSVVCRCRLADGRGAVLKASPDRARLAYEAAALEGWHTVHTPAVLELDEQLGALLLEAIEPGTPLVVTSCAPCTPAAFPTPPTRRSRSASPTCLTPRPRSTTVSRS